MNDSIHIIEKGKLKKSHNHWMIGTLGMNFLIQNAFANNIQDS